MSVNRYRVIWSGGPGGQGVSTFYSADTETSALADIRAFFNSIANLWPNIYSWTFPSSGDTIDLANGKIDGSWSQPSAATVQGGLSSQTHPAGVGVRVRWETGGISNGRRVVGATFLTGLSGSSYQSDGTINNTDLATIQAAASTLAGQGWMRTLSKAPGGSYASFGVQSAVVPDRVSWLRSRRT